MQSARLDFINVTMEIVEAIVQGDTALSQLLQVTVPSPWTEFGIDPFRYTAKQIYDDPKSAVWWSWLPVFRDEKTLIGNCGYKGLPDQGYVEIGYEVAESRRRQGFATEIAQALIQRAFSFPEVQCVVAHTLAEENASVRVLRTCGFVFIRAIEDPHDGEIWRWELQR